MSSTAFSSNDDVILRTVDCKAQVTREEDLENVYEISQCTEWLSKNSYVNIALQFPDNLLTDAPKVANILQQNLPNTCIFILGDTSYGSCCVDEVGAQHYKADCIIHYGHSCLSPTTRLPVLYVFDKSLIDVSDVLTNIQEKYHEKSKDTILVYETSFAHIIDKCYTELQKHLPSLILSRLHIAGNASVNEFSLLTLKSVIYKDSALDDQSCHDESGKQHTVIYRCGRSFQIPQGFDISNYNFIFLGIFESPVLLNLMMSFNKCNFFIYNSQNQDFESANSSINVNKALMKRYYLVERVKDANIVGIVVGTLGVERYKEAIDHLKELLKKAGKKTYTFVIGKLNPAKLANFAEVDIYVLVSCLESSLLEQKDFYRPVVSPYEVEIACNKAREWDGEYTSDFAEILPGSTMHIKAPEDFEYTGEGDVSLITNRIRFMGHKESPKETPGKDFQELLLRSDAMSVVSAAENAGQFFSMRSWQGLEQKLGETPVVHASEGQRGIAASYDNENPQPSNK